MKKRLTLADIKAGSVWSADVLTDDSNLFVPAGVPVKQRDIDGLKRWGVTHVMTTGELVEMAAAGEASSRTGSEISLSSADFAGSRELYRRYVDLVDRLAKVFELVKKSEAVDAKQVDQLTQGILQLVRDEREEAISAILGSAIKEDSLARSGVNIAILSVVIGQTLRLPPYRLAYLSTGALLHDAGMLRIPETIIKKKGVLTEEEQQKIRAHPLLSYRIITKELLYPDDVGLIGLQHHERWDGDGYPRKNAAADIDPLARIVSVADAFEAMVSIKSYRNSMIGYAAMKNLLSDNSRRFDPEILKAFIKSMGVYPLGSTVLLNNAAIARVIETHPEAPLRPKLRLLVDEFGNRSEGETGEVIDLLAEKSVFIGLMRPGPERQKEPFSARFRKYPENSGRVAKKFANRALESRFSQRNLSNLSGGRMVRSSRQMGLFDRPTFGRVREKPVRSSVFLSFSSEVCVIRKVLSGLLPVVAVVAMCTSTWAKDCGSCGGGCEGGCESGAVVSSGDCGGGCAASCGTKTVYQKQY
ncbi:MAG: HD-GYP domain-containing protein, partial [Spirochaetota bacterium]